jgi:hypothetical protein
VIRTASWGCGLQSTTMIAMSVLGDLPILDHVIFCDLGWERAKTYATLDWYTEFIEEAGVPVHVLRTGNIRKNGGKPHAHIPFWTENGGPLRRQCTRHYKIRPSRRHIRRLLGLDPTLPPNPQPNSVEQWIGITTDEYRRARPSDVDYIINRYPLLQAGMSRTDCARYLYEHGLPIPPKSACICCPYRKASEWIDMRNNAPEEWEEACLFDQYHRHLPDMPPNPNALDADTVYIWTGREPLATADLEASAAREHTADQLPLFLLPLERQQQC